MDHYEELGLDRSASPEEIRQAYKRLVRLLHPDLCSDEPVRQLADLQMKRLNGMLAVLTNPAERANYDRALAGSLERWQSPRLPGVSHAPWPPNWFWTAAGAVVVLSLLSLLLREAPHAPQARQIETTEAARTAPAKQPVRRAAPQHFRARMSGGREPPAETNPDGEPSPEPPPSTGSRPEIESSPTAASSGHPAEASFPAIQPVQPAGAPARPTMSGEWLFVPSAHSKGAGLYPPEYIELRVTEEGGMLHGRYRARYRIADQAISPTVSFQFAGPADGDGASLPWIGAGGAKGEVSLRLINSRAMQVSWVATQMGEELGLISGTATLVRRLD